MKKRARKRIDGMLAARALGVLALASGLAPALALLASEARAVLANEGGPLAVRITSTAELTPVEASVHARLGLFRSFLGTPIDSTHFITAQHIGIAPTDTITFATGPNAGTYAIQSWADDPGSDLRIVKIVGTFQEWVPLSGNSYEANKTATIFGRGGPPQSPIVLEDELKGWTAGALDGAISWGRNVVVGTLGANQLYARFDRAGVIHEAGLTVGDSGGPWFALDSQGIPRLIGISAAVTGPFQSDVAGTPSGVVFEAALVDTGGLWIGPPATAVLVPENPVDVPSVLVASRISNRISWIGSQIEIPVDDADHDGIVDQFDNCPFTANANQTDTGGLGSGTTPDGIGNACQCGDVTGEGQVNDTDAAFIKRRALGLSAPLFVVLDNCDVSGEGKCSGVDGTLIRHAAAGNAPAAFGQNCPNARP